MPGQIALGAPLGAKACGYSNMLFKSGGLASLANRLASPVNAADGVIGTGAVFDELLMDEAASV